MLRYTAPIQARVSKAAISMDAKPYLRLKARFAVLKNCRQCH